MSDPSPIYKNPLGWWQNRLTELENRVLYMDEHGIPVPAEDRQLLEVARGYVTLFVIKKLEDD
jgi:hypothetical protein